MKLPRDLSGRELIKVLCRDFGYVRAHQEGSHVVLQTETPGHHRIAIPFTTSDWDAERHPQCGRESARGQQD